MADPMKLAIVALELCNSKHEQDGRTKIPLDEIAEELYVIKEDIQTAFHKLVAEGIISDDGDYDHMNYSTDNAALIEMLLELLNKRTTDIEKHKKTTITY